MRVLLATMLVLSSATISLSHEIYFGDTRVPGSVQATWKPDGTQFATWGSSPYVEIWRVSDGLRLMVLDHVAPIQIFISPTAFIADMSWSDDGQTITTVIHSNNHESLVHQQRWSATTGELLYSFVVATANVHMPRLDTHKIIGSEELVASWTAHRVSYMDIELGSPSLGQEVAAIDFGDLTADRRVYWKADDSQALFTLHEPWDKRCPECVVYYRLVDVDPHSDTFGETLWQLEEIRFNRGEIWYSASDMMAIHRAGTIELWDLSRRSERFGEQILRIEREFDFFHNVLFDETKLRVIVVEQNNMALIDGAHPDAGPQCIEERCEYHIGIWDLDRESLTFGERLTSIVHLYAYDTYGSRVAFNESETQIHVHVVNRIKTEDSFDFEVELFAYDLISFAATEARDIAPEPVYGWNLQRGPQVDLSHLEDSRTRYVPIALHPDGTKLLTRKYLGEDRLDSKMSTLVINIETGEQLLPEERRE